MAARVAEYIISEENLRNAALSGAKNQESCQKMLAVSDETLERYYGVAKFFLDQKRFEDASDAFTFLLFLNSKVHSFWLGLGMAEQSLSRFKQACIAYTMAQMTDPTNPIAFANGFQCSTAIGDTVYADFCRQNVLELCGDKEEFASLKKMFLSNEDEAAV